jgi:PAS domain-containing protein
MRELARIRAQAARLRSDRAPVEPGAATALLEDALQLLDTMRVECGALQQRCAALDAELSRRRDGDRQLFDALPQAIVTTDGSGAILDANREAAALLSRSRAKLTGDLLLHFAEDRHGFSQIVRALTDAPGTLLLRARFRPADRAPFDAAVSVLRDPRTESPQWLWLLTRDPAPAR